MCGIIGYVGQREAVPVLLQGLRRLEYRGYDSTGVAVATNGRIAICKTPGRVDRLEERLRLEPLSGTMGLSHSRWATHGEPNEVNAHPHIDCTGDIAVVHNGIIENFETLRRDLERRGHRFRSQTDTEILAHLIEAEGAVDLERATRRALRRVEGSYAVGVISRRHPGVLVGARMRSPLVIGVGKGEWFLASDIPAVLDYTNQVVMVNDGEVAVLKRDSFEIKRLAGARVHRQPVQVTWSIEQAEKEGYPHFMLKEIEEQPEAIEATVRTRLATMGQPTLPADVMKLLRQTRTALKRIAIVSCGTAYHAGLFGRYLIEQCAPFPVEIDVSSEFRYRSMSLKGALVIAVSQSGETADTLAAARLAKTHGAKVLAICNVVGSSLTREADATLYTLAGPEIAVASTKAYTTQLAAFVLVALALSQIHRRLSARQRRQVAQALHRLPSQIEAMLKQETLTRGVDECVSRYRETKYFLYLGRHLNYPTALEGALKLKEICYISAEGYAAGEMKHGPIALAHPGFPVIAIAPQSPVYEKMVSSIQEIKARKSDVIAVVTEGNETVRALAEIIFAIPKTHEWLTPILAVIPLQLVAYRLAVALGNDVDRPRNLAKSVTVE